MALVLDPIYIVNLTLCIIILILGIFGYRKKGNPVPLYVGIAFGLFGGLPCCNDSRSQK